MGEEVSPQMKDAFKREIYSLSINPLEQALQLCLNSCSRQISQISTKRPIFSTLRIVHQIRYKALVWVCLACAKTATIKYKISKIDLVFIIHYKRILIKFNHNKSIIQRINYN